MGLPLSATTTGSGAAPPAASGSPAPATSAPEGSEDPAVAVSFALGWQMADLYRDPHHKRPDPSPPPDDLPGISGLTESRRTDLGIRQIEAGLHRLSDRTSAAGLLAPSTKSLRQAFESESDEVGATSADLPACILALHVEVLETLTAADFRLGKAYGLGRAMADTAEAGDEGSLNRRFGHWRLRVLDAWLADLDSALPAHASGSVRMSLTQWEKWAENPRIEGSALNWDRDGEDVRAALHRQGQRWRALLSGEKEGQDMLKAKDYLDAVHELLSRAGRLLWALLKQLWFFVAAVLALVGAAVWLLATSDTTTSNIAAVGAFAASLGITWQGIGQAAARNVARLEQPLWGAALNVAIADAITELPRRGLTAGREEARPAP